MTGLLDDAAFGVQNVVMTPVAIARFWSKVEVLTETECWPWRGARDPHGYGRFRNPDTGKTELTHRTSFFLVKGYLPPPEVDLRHTCDNPPCCNPFHSIPGTRAQNMQDASERGRLIGVHPNHAEKCPRGEQAPMTKLTEPEVLAIRHRISAGEHPKNLAREYGISPSNISNITKRRTWTHI